MHPGFGRGRACREPSGHLDRFEDIADQVLRTWTGGANQVHARADHKAVPKLTRIVTMVMILVICELGVVS